MATASMERLQVNDKITLGAAVDPAVPKPKNRNRNCCGHWPASVPRDLLYGSIDRVTPPAEVGGWVETILARTWKNPKPVAEMLSQLCRKTGDPLRDVAGEISDQAAGWIDAAGDFPDQVARITRQSARKQKERNTIFGESLPAGLIMEDR